MALEVPRPLAQRIKGSRPPAEALRALRASLDWMREQGLLLESDVEVDPDLEITGVQKHLDGTVPILFHKVKGYPHLAAVTNLFTNIEILDRMFGYESPQARTRKLAHALTHPIPPQAVSGDEAPCQEVVMTDDLDVNKWVPAIRHTHLETE